MSFLDAMWLVVSFLWSPTMVVILMLVLFIVCLIEITSEWDESPYYRNNKKIALFIILVLLDIFLFMTLIVYWIDNEIGPLFWTPGV